MKIEKTIFVPDLAGDISDTPGKGILRLEPESALWLVQSPKILTNVRFNQFQSRDDLTHLIDRVNTANRWSFQRGVPNANHLGIDSVGQLTNRNIYARFSPAGSSNEVPGISVKTHTNLVGSNTKMVTEYSQRALSLGENYLPSHTYVGLRDATEINLQTKDIKGTQAVELTYMLRIMIDNTLAAESKCVFAIADARGSTTSFQINATGGFGGPTLTGMVVEATPASSHLLTTTAGKIEQGKWYTVFFRVAIHGTTSYQSICIYDISEGNRIEEIQSNASSMTFPTLQKPPRAYVGYGEASGGVNSMFNNNDFVKGVHIAELAVFEGYLQDRSASGMGGTIPAIARAHLQNRQFGSGIDSRPVKRVQQIFDSMDSYPASPFIAQAKNVPIQPYNSMNELNFGSFISGTLRELMVYPEMLPARLYSGSGGEFYNASYFPYSASLDPTSRSTLYPAANRIPLKDGQFRDIRDTPFEFRLLASGAAVPNAAHKETLLLNKVKIASGTFPSNTIANTVLDALGGAMSPFNDSQASADSSIVNEIAVEPDVYPGLDQRLGDSITIEIPIPTIEDAVLGVDSTQGRIASMAYYNVAEQRWDRKFMPGVSGSNVRAADELWGENGPASTNNMSFWQDVRSFLLNSCSIGFGGTSGFSIFSDEGANALMDLSTRGRPTSMYGFPHTDQYVAELAQTIKISDYIDEPFLLEKISVEFDAEIEEAGPGSIATHIRTPGRWRGATQWYKAKYSATDFVKQLRAGIGGANMFFRSYESTEYQIRTVNSPTSMTVKEQEGIIQTWDQWPKHGGLQEQVGFADWETYGYTPFSMLNAQAHMSPFPTFVGGNTRPSYAEFFDVYETESPNVSNSANAATFYKDFIWAQNQVDKSQDSGAKYGHGFPTSVDRLFAIQDTSNDASTISGTGNQAWRGWYNATVAHTPAIGNPDFLASVNGYHTSRPSLVQYYNIPAGVFLPQLERAIDPTGTGWAFGRRDGLATGGQVKLLFGGISGLVTGSYTPHPGPEQNYFSSGSDPRTTEKTTRWNKKTFESRNYVSFIDSFSITSGGLMTSTAGIRRDGSQFSAAYDPADLPKSTGGAPFWRCDTFFLLHQKRGKNRFVGGEFDIITAPAKDSFERLQGETSTVSLNGRYYPRDGGSGASQGVRASLLKNNAHQSAVLASAASDGLGAWNCLDTTKFLPIRGRRARIRLEETLNEFTSSLRTTNRELITYAQMTHYGYAAAEAVIPDAVIPPENYYVQPLKTEGSQPGPKVHSDNSVQHGTGVDVNGVLLPVTRSMYSQAIKLGATNVSWPNVGTNASDSMWLITGPGFRTAYGTETRLYNDLNVSATPESQKYTTSSDAAETQYLFGGSPVFNYGVHGAMTNRGTGGVFTNPMFLDPGAGSGNGLLWRFCEYDAVGDVFGNDDSKTGPYKTGRPLMRQFRWEQWFENPVYGGNRESWCDTNQKAGMWERPGGRWQGFPRPLPGTNNGDSNDYTGGSDTVYMKGVASGHVPLAVKNLTGVGGVSGSVAGGKLNYMQMDWRYQCGTHYNSGMDSAPIGLAPGPRYRLNETNEEWTSQAEAGRPSTKATSPWYVVGGRMTSSPATPGGKGVVTGSDYIGSMISSASQPWHGTAITRSGFSLISSPTTPVPSGTHPDLAIYGSFHNPGLNWTKGGVGGYCHINAPAYRKRDRYVSASMPVKLSNWLDAGLSRDLDIEVSWKMKHSRTDINGGEAGFTILTASTVFPPGDLAGRFNGDHKLRATFKERRLLNAGKFRIVSDIKSQPASSGDSSALFVHTAPAKNMFLIGTGAMRNANDYNTNHVNFALGGNTRFSNDRIWWRAYAIEDGYLGNTTANNWEGLVGNPPELTSGRRYVAAIAGNVPVTSHLVSGTVSQMSKVNIPQWGPGPGLFRASYGPLTNFNNDFGMVETGGEYAGRINAVNQPSVNNILQKIRGQSSLDWSKAYTPIVSASIHQDKPKTSLYLLMPGDEVVLGFQPSLQGGNRGNNTIPMNPNVNPYGPWRDGIVDRHGFPTGSAYNPEHKYSTDSPRTEKWDSRNQGGYHLRRGPNKIIHNGKGWQSVNNANMETLYEPRSSITLKKSPTAKLVLYGTLLRNKKHLPPDSTVPPQRTNVIHQTIMGAPVTDQFQVEPTYAYSGSYIAHHVTGNIVYTQRNRYDMSLPPFKAGINVLKNSPFSPTSPSYVPLGGPYGYKKEYIRAVYKPDMRDILATGSSDKQWLGLGLPDADGLAGPAGTTPYWPKAPSTSMNMGISGSIQRFVRLIDDSEFYYDSCTPNPRNMFRIDLEMSGANAAVGCSVNDVQVTGRTSNTDATSHDGWPPVGLGVQGQDEIVFNFGTTSWMTDFSQPWVTAASRGRPEYPFWPNPYINFSFPFSERYSQLQRRVNRSSLDFGSTGSIPVVLVPENVYFGGLANLTDEGGAGAPADGQYASGLFPTGSQSKVVSIRIADENNDRNFELQSNTHWITRGASYKKTIMNYVGAYNMVEVVSFGWWKQDFGDRPLPRWKTSPQGYNGGHDNSDKIVQLDHPSGWKYGLMNYKRTASSAVFRMDRYGQLRDMLEQRQYTRFYDTGDAHTPAGLQESAVTCIFVDGDGSPIEDTRETSCLNVSHEMTSSVPYKEGETARTFLFSRQTVTISPLVQSFTASPFLSL